MQRVMRGTERAVTHARTDAHQFHGPIRIGNIVLDLLQGPRGQKAGRRDGKHLLAERCQAGGNAHQVLLGNADLYDLRRQRLAERHELA